MYFIYVGIIVTWSATEDREKQSVIIQSPLAYMIDLGQFHGMNI